MILSYIQYDTIQLKHLKSTLFPSPLEILLHILPPFDKNNQLLFPAPYHCLMTSAGGNVT